jgi:hypothetical protein
MISKNTNKTQLDVDALIKDMTCPIDLEPLYQAVTLTPCCHKINQIGAEYLFGKADKESGYVPEEGKCPLCKKIVIGYYVDHSFRNLVKTIFSCSNPKDELSELPNNPILIKHIEDEETPYFNKRGKFIHSEGNWKLFKSGGRLCKQLIFQSITKDSFITEFEFLGYKDKSITIKILINENYYSKELINYLYNCDLLTAIPMSDLEYLSYAHIKILRFKNHEQKKKIFNILIQNNEIPVEYLELLKKLVEKGSWDIEEEQDSNITQNCNSHIQSILSHNSNSLQYISLEQVNGLSFIGQGGAIADWRHQEGSNGNLNTPRIPNCIFIDLEENNVEEQVQIEVEQEVELNVQQQSESDRNQWMDVE